MGLLCTWRIGGTTGGNFCHKFDSKHCFHEVYTMYTAPLYFLRNLWQISGLWLTSFCISPQVALRDEILWQPDRGPDPTTSRSETESATTELQKLAYEVCLPLFQRLTEILRNLQIMPRFSIYLSFWEYLKTTLWKIGVISIGLKINWNNVRLEQKHC